jgi:hypothetical protein
MANERLVLELQTVTVGEEAVNRLSSNLEKVVNIGERAQQSLGRAPSAAGWKTYGEQVGASFDHVVSKTAAASAAVRAFEGNLSVRATENFLSSVLKLGPAFQAAFPLIGGEAQAAAVDIGTYQAQLNAFTVQRNRNQIIASNLAGESAQAQEDQNREQQEKAVEAARKATEDLARSDAEDLARLKASHALSVGEVIRYWQTRLNAESTNVDREREITITLGTLYQERDRTIRTITDRGRQIQDEEQKKAEKQLAFFASMADEATRLGDEIGGSIASHSEKRATLATRGQEISTSGVFSLQRLQAGRAASLDTDDPTAARIREAATLLKIDQDEAAAKLESERRVLAEIQALYGQGSEQYATQQNRILEIQNSTNEQIYAAQTKLYADLAELRQKDVEAFRSTVGGYYDAITSRNPRALPDLIRTQGLSLGRTVTENLAQTYLMPTISALTPHFSGALGAAFKGTPFGPKADPLSRSASALNTSAALLSGAARDLSTAARGGSVAGSSTGSAASSAGGGVDGSADFGIPSSWTALPPFVSTGSTAATVATSPLARLFSGSGFGGALGNFGSGASSALSGYALSVASDPGFNLSTRIGAGVGLGGALATGGYQIYSGLQQGGVGGDLKATGEAGCFAAAHSAQRPSEAVN